MPGEHEVEVNGVHLYYRESGPPDAPPIVALHAAGQDASTWDGIAAGLAEGWRVLAVDLRGHGRSAAPAGYSFDLLRADVAAFIEALELAPVVLLGHSLGGTVALLLAETRPELLRLLVVEDTPPARRGPRQLGFPDTAPRHLRIDPRAWTALMGELADPDPRWWDDLATIPVPTLIVAGGSTSFVPQDELAAACELIPDAGLVTIEGAGHQVHHTRPAEYLARLRRFLDEHLTSS